MRDEALEELRQLRARQPELAAAVDAACALAHSVTVRP
jgi:hypothetical protein